MWVSYSEVHSMIICFKCSQETKEALDKLLLSKQYSDHAEIISVAINNLAVLQSELPGKGVLVIGEANQSHSSGLLMTPPRTGGQRAKNGAVDKSPRNSSLPQQPRGTQTKKSEQRVKAKAGSSMGAAVTTTAPLPFVVPPIFSLDGLREGKPPLANPPEDVWLQGMRVPLHRWLFGQYNKLLPAKASSRALAHLLREHPNGVPLSEATAVIGDQAILLGDFLLHKDGSNGLRRDEALATAFPTTKDGEESVEKGRTRYTSQFVANVISNGRLSGLLVELKLINYDMKKDPILQLTEVGWRFASMGNPVLDGSQMSPTQKFSSEEIDLMLSHIANGVPAEDFAFRAILSAIRQGANTPDTLDTELRVYAPANHNLTDSFLSSQRSGAISRMADLELVARVRDGVRVIYTITPRGNEYLGNVRSA
jgi:hypothetical protein